MVMGIVGMSALHPIILTMAIVKSSRISPGHDLRTGLDRDRLLFINLRRNIRAPGLDHVHTTNRENLRGTGRVLDRPENIHDLHVIRGREVIRVLAAVLIHPVTAEGALIRVVLCPIASAIRAQG